jgi:16S rRNA (guanine1207-N2)-methyltransferase
MMLETEINGISLKFKTHKSLFSPSQVDGGTLALLSRVSFGENEKVLDLGCGYGPIGIYAAKMVGESNVVMSDNSDIAVETAKKNAELNGVDGIKIIKSSGFNEMDETGFTLILVNPPYHADFSVAKHFVEKGFNRLQMGGRFMMVTHRLLWYKNKLTSTFGGVKVIEDGNYCIFTSEKRSMTYASMEKKTAKAKAKQ